MSTVTLSLTQEELDEMRIALETHVHKLSNLYGGRPNPDWAARSKRLSALRTKLATADIQGTPNG